MVYEQIEPPAEIRIDIGFATLASMLANIHRDDKKCPEPYSALDFLPPWMREDKPEEAGPKPDGMDPAHVTAVMERLQKHQELVEKQRALRGASTN